MDEKIVIRLKSFGYELLGLVITGLGGFLLSQDFADLVSTHFGETLTASIIMLAVSGVAKHLRNIKLDKQFGAGSSAKHYI